MSFRSAPALISVAASLCLLAGCASNQLAGLWSSKNSDQSAAQQPADADTTGSVATSAESGPSGEPEGPLAKPGPVGDDPNDDLQRGKRYFRKNDFGLAEKSFRSAAEKHPNDAEAWIGLAATYDRLRRFELADRAYSAAIRIVGRSPEVLNNLGFSYLLRGDYARAQKTLKQAQAKDPSNPYIQANLHLLEESYSGNSKAAQ